MRTMTTRRISLTFAAPCSFSSVFSGVHLRRTNARYNHNHHHQHKHRRCLATVTSSLRPRIAVLGGGFGGLSTALKLADMRWTRLTRPDITLIDRNERFAFLPMMYELATGEVESWEVAPTFRDLLQDSSINYKQAAVTGVDLETGIDIDDNILDKFDRVVVALGAESANIDSVKGAAEHALPFYNVTDAFKLREKLRELRATRSGSGDKINIVVIGGGFSGVELAACKSVVLSP